MAEVEKDFLATFIVRSDSNPMNLPVGAEFTEKIRGMDPLDAVDAHGGWSWAEYSHATPWTKKSWKELPPDQKAQWLLDHKTLSDKTWTEEERLAGEGRSDFIKRILGFERVPDANACDSCNAAEGAIYKTDDVMPVHENCQCGSEPVFEDEGEDRQFHDPVPDDADLDVPRLDQTDPNPIDSAKTLEYIKSRPSLDDLDDRGILSILDDQFETWYDGMSSDVIAGWTRQSGTTYKQIYKWLRDGRPKATSPLLKEMEKVIDDMVETMLPTKEDLTVLRGMHGSTLREALGLSPDDVLDVGTVLTDKAFISTTLDPVVAERYSKGGQRVLMEIKVPKGTRAVWNGDDLFSELTLPPGTKLKITKIDGGIVQAEVVPVDVGDALEAAVKSAVDSDVAKPFRPIENDPGGMFTAEALDDEFTPWVDGLSTEVSQMWSDYTSYLFKDFNGLLRGEAPSFRLDSEELRAKLLGKVKSMVAESKPLAQDTVTYRGLQGTFNKLFGHDPEVGGIIEDAAFQSTSASRSMAKTFASDSNAPIGSARRDGVLIEVQSPAGTRASYLGSENGFGGEFELVLNPGTRMEIVEVKSANHIVARVLPDSSDVEAIAKAPARAKKAETVDPEISKIAKEVTFYTDDLPNINPMFTLQVQARVNLEKLQKAGGARAEFAQLVKDWTGAGNKIDDVRPALLRGERADALNIVKAAAPTDNTLWRGVRAYDDVSSAAIRGLEVGQSISLNTLSSFSNVKGHAQYFMGGHKGTAHDRVLIEVLPGNKALPLKGIANSPLEQEWLMAGNDLEVVNVVSKKVVEGDTGSYTEVHVQVRQKADG